MRKVTKLYGCIDTDTGYLQLPPVRYVQDKFAYTTLTYARQLYRSLMEKNPSCKLVEFTPTIINED